MSHDHDARNLGSDHSDQEGIESTQTHYKTSFTAIRKARRFALQGLYSWSLTDLPINEIEAKTRSDNAMHTVHLGYYHELLSQITAQVEAIDALIETAIDRPIAMITKIELAVLRIGVFELKYRLEIPFKVVIDEAIQLNEHFGSDQGYRFINAVMDKLASELRTLEVTELEHAGARKPKKPYTPKAPRVKKSLERAGASSHTTETGASAKPASSGARLGRKRVETTSVEPAVLSAEQAQTTSAAIDEPVKLPAQAVQPDSLKQSATSTLSDAADTAEQPSLDQSHTQDHSSTDLAAANSSSPESGSSEPAPIVESEAQSDIHLVIEDRDLSEVEASSTDAEPDAKPNKPASKAAAKPKTAAKPRAAAKPKAAANVKAGTKPKAAAKPKAEAPAKAVAKPAAKPRSKATAKPKPEAD